MSIARYDLMAKILGYPDEDLPEALDAAIELCATDHPEAAESLRRFRAALPLGDLVALRELHTRTFDVQPITSLDVGYTLFGEDYKRGAMLAHLSREHAQAGNECGLELADHLTNVLRLLPRWQDATVRVEFVRVLLAPAIAEMIREFLPDRLEKKTKLYERHHKTVLETAPGERRLAYRDALVALERLLTRDYGVENTARPGRGLPVYQESKFVGAVSAEMGIEEGGSAAME